MLAAPKWTTVNAHVLTSPKNAIATTVKPIPTRMISVAQGVQIRTFADRGR